MVVKAQYLCSMQVNTNWYRYQHHQNHVIIVPTRTILHPRLDVTKITDIHDIPKSVCNREQAEKFISIYPICLTDSDDYSVLEVIDCREKI